MIAMMINGKEYCFLLLIGLHIELIKIVKNLK